MAQNFDKEARREKTPPPLPVRSTKWDPEWASAEGRQGEERSCRCPLSMPLPVSCRRSCRRATASSRERSPPAADIIEVKSAASSTRRQTLAPPPTSFASTTSPYAAWRSASPACRALSGTYPLVACRGLQLDLAHRRACFWESEAAGALSSIGTKCMHDL